jgi:hypothetical protein
MLQATIDFTIERLVSDVANLAQLRVVARGLNCFALCDAERKAVCPFISMLMHTSCVHISYTNAYGGHRLTISTLCYPGKPPWTPSRP